jgi:hypothetical protein
MAKRSRRTPGRSIYTLHSECLENEGTPGNIWQIEGGKVVQKGKHVGHYSSVKRVSCGTVPQNVAQFWLTLFFLSERPPQNITLHGAHDFSTPGNAIGSVSAASSAFKANIGKQFKRVRTPGTPAAVTTLTIG